MSIDAVAVTGGAFIVAALLLWSGWVFLPHKIGVFFEPDDFGKVKSRFHCWIWMYRVHLIGHPITVMALVSLGALLSTAPATASVTVLLWPGIAVAAVGLVVSALAQAFYYHFGAWGAQRMEGKTETEIESHVESLEVVTEYLTCWTRFGRVFLGLGFLVLAAGLAYAGAFPIWLTVALGIIGLASILLTMLFPDNLEYYGPVFHLNALWLLAAGIVLLAG